MAYVIRIAPAVSAALVPLLLAGTVRAGEYPLETIDGLSARASENSGPPDNQIGAFNSCDEKPPNRFETSASFLLLQPSSGNLVYSTVINPYPLLTPHWSDQAVNPDFSPAFNVGVRYIFDCSGDIELNWTHLNTFDNSTTLATNPLPPFIGPPPLSGASSTQLLGPSFLIGPPAPYATASAVAHFAFDAVNLDAGVWLSAGSHVRVRTFAGLQVARISQSLSTNFLSTDRSISFTDASRSLFTGVGPRLGIDMHYVTGNLGLLGQIAGSTIMGTRQSRIDFFTSSPQTAAAGITPNAQYLTSPDMTQVVPCIDAKLGATYAIPVGNFGILKCEAGYQAAVYFNAINQYSLTEVENTAIMNFEGTAAVFLRSAVELQSNFLVHGPYAKISFEF